MEHKAGTVALFKQARKLAAGLGLAFGGSFRRAAAPTATSLRRSECPPLDGMGAVGEERTQHMSPL